MLISQCLVECKYVYGKLINLRTPRCFKGPHLPISMFNSKQPNDHKIMSTAVVYSTSYGPAITRCIDTYSTCKITYIHRYYYAP